MGLKQGPGSTPRGAPQALSKAQPNSGRPLPRRSDFPDTPAGLQAFFAACAAHATGADSAEFEQRVHEQREASEAERLQKESGHRAPGVNLSPGVPQKKVNRQLRRAARRNRKTAKVIAAMIARAREEGADPNWKPEAFPELDWRIRSEVWPLMRDVSGRKARIFAAALPPAQAEQLILEAERLGQEIGGGIEAGFRSLRWRELVAGAWVSWRLSRPVRARDHRAGVERAQLGDEALGYVPPPLGLPAVPVKRKNPWAGGRVVDGYAREAFALLMRDIQTGECLSINKLFYRNGSGTQGVFGYLATPAPEGASGRRSRALSGVLGLYTRWQPPAATSKYVGPPKRGADGQPLLDAFGNVQRYALSEHWYHARMCGRRAAAQSDRGNASATGVLRRLCPWLFEGDKTPEQLVEELAARELAVEGGAPPALPEDSTEPAVGAPTTAPPD